MGVGGVAHPNFSFLCSNEFYLKVVPDSDTARISPDPAGTDNPRITRLGAGQLTSTSTAANSFLATGQARSYVGSLKV